MTELVKMYCVYDGACPFCSLFVEMKQVRGSASPVELIDARENNAIVKDLISEGFNLNEGMILVIGSEYYFGAEAIQKIALLNSQDNFSSRLYSWCFRDGVRARLIYPFLKICRKLTLKLMSIKNL